jgi:O-antigen ligase/Flp pilus assembly protein TadD
MKLQKALAYIAIGSVFLILLTPFIFYTGLYFPFITAKAYYFRVIVELGFAAWLGLAILDPVYRPKKSWLLWALSAFMFVLLVANLQGANPTYSFWSNFERMEGYVTFLHLFAFFFVVTGVMQTKRLWNWFLNTAVVVGVAQVGWAALQVGGVLAVGLSADRIDGTLGNATYLAIYMVFTFFIAFLLLMRHEGEAWVKYWYVTTMSLSTLALFWTATRGSLLGLIGGLVLTVALLVFFERRKKTLQRAAIGVLVLVVLFVSLVLGFKESALVQNVNALRRVADISFTETTTIARFYNWQTAWQGIKERPVLGYGLGNYGPVFDKYYNPKMWSQEQWFDRVHNVVFDWLIAGGFLGLLAYLSLFVALMYYIWKPAGPFTPAERAVLTGLIAAYCFHNLFVFDNLISYIYFFIVMGYIHVRVSKPFFPEAQVAADTSPVGSVIAIVLLVAVFPVTAWMINADSYRQGTALISAMRIREVDRLPEITSTFAQSLSYNTFGDTETRQQLLTFTGRLINTTAGKKEDKVALVALTQAEMQKEIDARPNDPKFLALAGQLLAQSGNLDQAKLFFERAVSLSPKKQALYQPLIEVLFKQGKPKEALALASSTYMIETANDATWRQYVRSALRAEEKALYDALIAEAFATGRGDRVVGLAQQNLEATPDSVQAHASLAIAYYQAGMIPEAIAKFTEIGELFPEAKPQVDGLIKKIEAGEPII